MAEIRLTDDLISRQAAIDAAIKAADEWDGMFPQDRNWRIMEAIDKLPSAERRGKWEFIGGYGYQYRCTACILCAEHKTRYCPNCGARMKGVDDD